jgi:hypothetical protein
MPMGDPAAVPAELLDGVAEYKAILQRVLESRPSGTRQRIAAALSKNRSFVTQITSPAYDTPIPAKHVERIVEICHFAPAEREAFLLAYRRAHPGRRSRPEGPRMRAHTLYLPDLGTPDANRRMDALVGDFVENLIEIISETRPRAVRAGKQGDRS